MPNITATVSANGVISPSTIVVASGAATIVYNLDSGATWSATPGIVVNATANGTSATWPGPTGSVTYGSGNSQRLVYTNPGVATLTFGYAQINVTGTSGAGGGAMRGPGERIVGDSDPIIQNQGGGGGGGDEGEDRPGKFDRNAD